MDESNRVVYITGLMDGFFASGAFGATGETVAALDSCTKGMDNKQVSAIITKYVKDHPEAWHQPLSIEAFNALNTVACHGGLIVD
jgi:Ssp1 endopeptidase immunity protein Rap1a